jgi:hypothetical protein
MKKLLFVMFVAALAIAAEAQEKTCPGCGLDVKNIYSGGTVSGTDNSSGPALSIEKSAPAQIIKGDTLPVTIALTNRMASVVTVTLKESFGGAQPEDMGGFTRMMPDITSAPPYYKMTLYLGPGEKKTITYKIKPLYYGKYKIPGTEVSSPSEKIKSSPITVLVECDANGICETEKDENALTCPQDCKPDQKDELCDPLADGACDPDCPAGIDPDCGIPTTTIPAVATTPAPMSCGNRVCELEKNESRTSCPSDCASGARDGYCDAVSDGICDPDCKADEDRDCGKPTDAGLVLVVVFIVVVIGAAFYAKRWLKKR